MYKSLFKPGIDLISAFLLLVLFAPLIIILIIVLSISNKGTPFFLQARPGKNGKIFHIIKFKTMKDLELGADHEVHSPKRITKVGGLIRKYSLDELMQLVNVLKGDMSLVGPRPLLVEYLPLYDEEQMKRHDVKPGITGWAQVNGRNNINWHSRFKLDQWYVENLCFTLDLKVICLTIMKVISKADINQGKDTIMPVWQGNRNTEEPIIP